VFSGARWIGEKAVLLWVARMLRRWKPMYGQDLELKVDYVIQELEKVANRSPSLCWYGEMQSKVGEVWFSVFGIGLRRCDTV
jgi:hypothetical protein